MQQPHRFPKISHGSSFVFGNSEITGDLNYFIKALKFFAQVLTKDGIDELEMIKGNHQPFWTASGLINFLSSAEDLFRSDNLTRQEYATLIYAVFEEQKLIEALYHLFRNPRVLGFYHAENHSHLCDLLRIATNYYYVKEPQDSVMLKKPVSAAAIISNEVLLGVDPKEEEVMSPAISSNANIFEHDQYGSDDCNINHMPYKKIRIVGNDQTDVLFEQVYHEDKVIDFLGGKYLLPRSLDGTHSGFGKGSENIVSLYL